MKINAKSWCLLFFVFLCYGCATVARENHGIVPKNISIKAGMTKADLAALLGEPKSSTPEGENERLVYSFEVAPTEQSDKVKPDRYELNIWMENGKAKSWVGAKVYILP